MLDEELHDGVSPARPTQPRRSPKHRSPRVRLQVCVSAEEAARIEAAAKAADLSVSAFLRALGLGYKPMAVVDLDEALKLNHLGSNLGRLGGLLKLWISEGPPPERYSKAEFKSLINDLIDQVRGNQEAMQRTVRHVLKAHPRIRRARGGGSGGDTP